MDTIKTDIRKVKMIAHRGLSGIERENTCPAFVAAGNRSYYAIETDVHRTLDGKFVVIHDETTQRVSLGSDNTDVEKSTYEEIKNIVLPDLDESTHRQDIRIPLLKDYVKICKKYQKVCVLELKNTFEKNDIKRMIEEIKQEEWLDNVIFISFSLENCLALRSILKHGKIQYLTKKDVTKELMALLKKNKFDLDINYKCLTKEIVASLHKQGTEVNCWTCDDKNTAHKLADMGVDYITTNILE